MNKNERYHVSLIVVFLAIIWAPIQAFIVLDGAGRIPFMLLLMMVFLNWSEIKSVCFCKPLVYYMVLAPYMYINGLAHQSQLLYAKGVIGYFLMGVAIFQPVMIMLIVICLAHHNFDKTLKHITRAILVYCLLCFMSGSMSYYGAEGARLASIINANEVALMIAVGFACIVLLYVRKHIKLFWFLLLGGVLVFADLLTGSRMGFVMVGIIVVVSIIMLREKRNLGSLVLTVILLGGVFVLLNYAMENTVVGERLMNTTTQVEETGGMGTGTILDKFGDRGIQYYLGWPFFLEHPVFGIGFHQWVNVGPLRLVCHSEYLVQSLENGLFAFFLYMPFFTGIIRQLWRNRNMQEKQDSKTIKVLYSSMLAIVFANSVLWTFTCAGVFALYGMGYAITTNLKTK